MCVCMHMHVYIFPQIGVIDEWRSTKMSVKPERRGGPWRVNPICAPPPLYIRLYVYIYNPHTHIYRVKYNIDIDI